MEELEPCHKSASQVTVLFYFNFFCELIDLKLRDTSLIFHILSFQITIIQLQVLLLRVIVGDSKIRQQPNNESFFDRFILTKKNSIYWVS